jgi:DNA (cytosine-5)-methyltransferase 1
MKIGSLCTGYGGLDMAVEAYFNAKTVWCAEYDQYASKLIEERFGYVNHGDISAIDWASVEPIDILTAGYPCQPFSSAGQRKGTTDDRHIFPFILEAISTLRPKFVILENVRGHLSLGFKEVLASLTSIGYDARWEVVRASEVGAPHERARLFVVAYPTSEGLQGSGRPQGRTSSGIAIQAEPEEIPVSLVEGRLNPQFVEYLMGLPKGWVTDIELSYTQQLKILGNGVVPQQAYYALQMLCTPVDN